MAWCQEFAVQIRNGCDHLMVARSDSCACPECGVVCHGKFPGCATVWAAGPVQVTLRRPTRELLRAPAPLEVATNGKRTTAQAHPILALTPPGAAATEASSDLAVLVLSLRSEVQNLRRDVANLQVRVETSEDAAKVASDVATELPKRMGKALSAALRQQHTVLLDELTELRQQVSADVIRVSDTLQASSEGGVQEAIIKHIDARLQWLVGEISDRFVILGNEVVRLNKQLEAREGAKPPSNGQVSDRYRSPTIRG